MLKLNASFSKKVPAEQEYSSKGYSATIEVELPDGLTQEQLQERIHGTFALVEASVEAELNGGGSQGRGVTATVSAPPVTAPTAMPVLSNTAANPVNKADLGPASPKQIKYLTDIARKSNVSLAGYLRNYGVSQVIELDRKQCSYLIDEIRKQAA